MKNVCPILFLALAACPSKKHAHQPAPSGPLRAGAGQRTLDLPVGISTAGYSQSGLIAGPLPEDEPGSPFADLFPSTRGMQSAPSAKVVVLDNGHARIVLAKIDAVFITGILTERVIQLAKSMLGEEIGGQLILNATHTHDAGCRFSRTSIDTQIAANQKPNARHALAHGADTYSQEVTDRVARSIVGALSDALAHLRPAKFGYGHGDNSSASSDRRCENDWIDGGSKHQTAVTVLRLDDAVTNDPIAVVFHYAMHGTFYNASNRLLSVDAPGHAEYKVEEQFEKPIVAFYLQGAAGDARPHAGGDDGSQAMQRAGADLAQTVKTVYDGISTVDALPLQVGERWVPETHDLLGYRRGEFYKDGAILCQQLHGGCPGTAVNTPDVVCLAPAFDGRGKYATRVAAASIGDLALLTLPGEPTFAVGEELQSRGRAQGFKNALAIGYAQDHEGYILFDKDWLSGGYEPTISFWGWRFAQYIVDQSEDMLRELNTGEATKKSPATLPDLAPETYTPIAATNSLPAPSIDQEVATQVERLATVHFAFFGGDPTLGTPEIRLQQRVLDGSFADVNKRGWIPVSNLRGYELPVTYTATPTFRADPTATVRAHRWEVQYEPPIDLPTGTYRLHVIGTAQVDGKSAPLEIASSPFSVVPSTQLLLDGSVTLAGGKLSVEVMPLYPAARPTYAAAPNLGWQQEHFRLVDARFDAPFAPAAIGASAVGAVFTPADGTPASLSLAPTDRAIPQGQPNYAPGEGPSFHAEATSATATATITIAAGAFVDALGNSNAAAMFSAQAK